MISAYLKNHDVWPEMIAVLKRAGLENYSLFINKEDGTVVGYFEAEDPQISLDKIGASKINKKWQIHMANCFEGSSDMDSGSVKYLEQYFFLK